MGEGTWDEHEILDLLEALLVIYRDPEQPTVDKVLPLVKGFYEIGSNGAGGSLHIVLDDGNIEDRHVDFCIETAIKEGDALAIVLGRIIRRMSKTQRKRIWGRDARR
jgi:hypothetical protein